MHRQTDYTEEIASQVIELIASDTPLSKIGKIEGLPHKATILRWVAGEVEGVPDSFRDRYARAMEIQADSRFEGLRDTTMDESIPVDRLRVVVDAEKWILARQYRAKYGDRTAYDHGGQRDNPVQIASSTFDGSGMSPEDLAKARAFAASLLQKGTEK